MASIEYKIELAKLPSRESDPLAYMIEQLHEDQEFNWKDKLPLNDPAVPDPLFQAKHDYGALRSPCPLTPRDNRHAHPFDGTFHRLLGQRYSVYAPNTLKDDNSERFSDSDRLLKNRTRSKNNRRALSWTRRKPLRAYYHGARSLFLESVRDIRSLFHLMSRDQTATKIEISLVKYDQIPQASTSIYISEERFWLLLQRFFGLIPSSESPQEFLPTHDETAYIKNYLRSNPTPIQSGDDGDNGKDMVRICAKLATFIFRNRQSKRIFLGLYQNPGWEMFQGFGLIQRFYEEKGYRQQCSSIYVDQNWLENECQMTIPERRFMRQTWDSLQYLLSKKTAHRQHDCHGRYGLPEIYNQLAMSNLNFPGQSGIDFRHFHRKLEVRTSGSASELERM